MLSHSSAQRLRAPGYAILASMILFQFLEMWVRAWPFRIHAPAWRLGLVSAATGQGGITLLALLLIVMIAVTVEDRVVVLIVAAVSWVFAVLYVVAGGLFALDVLQFRGQVPGALAEQYGMSSAWVGVRLATTIGLLIWLAAASTRTTKGFSRQSRPSAIASAPLISATQRAERVQP